MSLPRSLGRNWLKTHQHPKCIYDLIAKLPKGAQVLDVGCGPGNTLTLFQKIHPGVNFWGTDLYLSKQNETNDSIQIVQADFTNNIPFKKESFDLVTCYFVLEHIETKDIDKFCNNLLSVIKPGGHIFLVFPNERSLLLGFYDDPTHIRPYSVDAVNKLMIQNNVNHVKSGFDRSFKILLLSPFYHLLSIFKKDPAKINFFLIHLVGANSFYLGRKI